MVNFRDESGPSDFKTVHSKPYTWWIKDMEAIILWLLSHKSMLLLKTKSPKLIPGTTIVPALVSAVQQQSDQRTDPTEIQIGAPYTLHPNPPKELSCFQETRMVPCSSDPAQCMAQTVTDEKVGNRNIWSKEKGRSPLSAWASIKVIMYISTTPTEINLKKESLLFSFACSCSAYEVWKWLKDLPW